MKESEGKYLGALLDAFHRSHTFVPMWGLPIVAVKALNNQYNSPVHF